MKLRLYLAAVSAVTLGACSYAQDVAIPAEITYPAGYTAKLDQTYIQAGGWQGKLDLYLPPKSNGPSPAVIKIHGGSWNHGSRVAPAAFTSTWASR